MDTAPITGAGQIFAMNMCLTQAGGDSVTYNLVNVFDKDRAIGWTPGVLDDEGNHTPGGWFWRYDLTPDGDRTEVTLTHDWSATPQDFRDRVGRLPIFPRSISASPSRPWSDPSLVNPDYLR